MSFQKHSFHLVDPSPWPFFGSIAALTTTVGAVMFFNAYTGGNYLLFLGIIMILFIMYVWWRDIVREGLYEGHHSLTVQLGLRYGMILFIISEIMFFVAFFWAFFILVLHLPSKLVLCGHQKVLMF